MAARHDATIYVDYYFHAVFKKFQMLSIGVVPESQSQMA